MLIKLQNELIVSMKSKQKKTIQALRNIIGKIKLCQIDKGRNLTENESILVLNSYAKKIKDSIIQFKEGGRNDLAKNEEIELQIIEKYLPKKISEEKIRILVKNIINNIKSSSITNIVEVMNPAMKELAGAADGNLVRKIVQEELNK